MNNSSFKEIWTSNKAKKIRDLLKKANRNFSPCNVCDVAGSLIGEKHAKSW